MPPAARLADTLIALQRESPHTRIFVTHSLEEAAYLGRKILVLDGAQIQIVDNPAGNSGVSDESAYAPVVQRLVSYAQSLGRGACAVKTTLRDAAFGLAVVVALWELVARLVGWSFVPPPSQVMPIFVSPTGRLILFHAAATLARVLLALAAGSLLGFPIGLLLGQSRRFAPPLLPGGRSLVPGSQDRLSAGCLCGAGG